MSAPKNFKIAERFSRVASLLFLLVGGASAILLATQEPQIISVVAPILVCMTIAGPILSIAQRNYQVKGNVLLRESQYRDGFKVPIGDEVRDDYYNTVLKPSVKRLGATTLENIKFTLAVVDKMLWWIRFKTLAYFAIFITLLVIRQTDLGWVLLATQSFFSGDVLLAWYSTERFRHRTRECRSQLKQHYIDGAKKESLLSHAFILRAFTNYECAKDEFATPLSERIFSKINPEVSRQWESEKIDLSI